MDRRDERRCAVCGIREIDMHHPSAPATITSTATMPVVSAVLIGIAGRSFTRNVRYTRQAEKQRIEIGDGGRLGRREQAAEHAPSRITGASSAQTAPLNASQTSRSPPNAWRARPCRGAMIATMIINDTPISTPGMTPARKSRPTDTSAPTP